MPITRRHLRWTTGLVLLAYTGSHLLNHAAGAVSLALAEHWRVAWFLPVWRSGPGTVVLYGALALHMALALEPLARRHSLRMPPLEAVRLALGLALPLLLASHAVSTRGAAQLHGVDDGYAYVAQSLAWPWPAGRQLLLMVAAWAHGAFGLHLALRHRAGWRRHLPWAVAALVALPLAAALGFAGLSQDAAAQPGVPGLVPSQYAPLQRLGTGVAGAWAALVGAVLAARALRAARLRWRGHTVLLRYPGRSVRVPQGWSVLEASRAHGVAHAAQCGGRARCSTCRVRVLAPPGALPPAGADEAATLRRIAAAADVRLACQLRPRADVSVWPLLRAAGEPLAEAAPLAHEEREVAVLFIDLRRWSSLAERQWPQDLVYLLGRYFEAVGSAVRDAGGEPNQFIGDSVMALFGRDVPLPEACRQALAAAQRVAERLAALEASLSTAFGHPLAFGMGLHCGAAAVGEMGWRDTRSLTAVGDVVNAASRLQELSRDWQAQLVVSDAVLRQAGVAAPPGQPRTVRLRGRQASVAVWALAQASALAAGPPPSATGS